MIFNSVNFLVIFPLLFLGYYLIPSHRTSWRNISLLAVSYLLYMNFRPAYALILLGVTVVTYVAAKHVEMGREKGSGGG